MTELLQKILQERDTYLRRGLEMAKYPHQSLAINEVFAAFAEAQAEFPSIAKDTQGYGYKYADLSVILKSIVPILSAHGLHFTQYMTRGNMLHSRIGHGSGQYFESQYEIPVPTEHEFAQGNKKTSYMQELGSRRTYIRRYEALALLGLQPQGDDTDGR